MRQVVGGAQTDYLWDEASLYGDVVLETGAGGAALASYVLGGPELLSQTRVGTTSYYLADAQGSTRALSNSAGAVTDKYDFTAFGELFASSGTTANTYLYTGQQLDGLTGLYSLRARYYDPGLGRFLGRDAMEVQVFNPVETNRYAYAAGNPLGITDPSGLGFGETALQYGLSKEQAFILVTALGTFFFITTMERLREFEPLGELEWVGPSIFGSDGTDPDKPPKPPGLWAVAWKLLVASILLQISGGVEPVVEGEPQEVEPPQPEPTPSGHVFYYSDVGPYPSPGRSSDDIIRDLTDFQTIPGIRGEIAQLRQAETLYDEPGGEWAIGILMGRKFESERAVFYAQRQTLLGMNATASGFDLIPAGLGSIRFIQVKWSTGPHARPHNQQCHMGIP